MTPDEFLLTATATDCAAFDKQHPEQLRLAKAAVAADASLGTHSIFSAAVVGNAEAVEWFLEENPDFANLAGRPANRSPLLYLTYSRFLRDTDAARVDAILGCAQRLLQAGADPNGFFLLGDDKESALYGACGVSNNATLARLLLNAGANANDGEATYHVAESDSHDCIRALFEFGMDIDHQATVLLRKLDFDDIEGVKVILQSGIDPNHPGIWGKTALHQAIMRGRSLAIIELIIQHGGDVNATRYDGTTARQLAEAEGRDDVVTLLQKHGADSK